VVDVVGTLLEPLPHRHHIAWYVSFFFWLSAPLITSSLP